MKALPNIILVLSDQHRGQAMGHAGDPNLRTPTMDRLAAEGVSFSRAYSNCPVCTPARGTLFSGRHAHAGPVQTFWDVYKPTAPSIATVLRGHGYHTAYYGKWHCGTVRDQTPPAVAADPSCHSSYLRTPEHMRAGFQDWRGYENRMIYHECHYYKDRERMPTRLQGYETDVFTDEVMDYLSHYDGEEPLFLTISIMPPHFPLHVPEKWKRHDPAKLEVRPNFGVMNPRFREHMPELPDADLRQMLANYYALIENLDWNMGRLVETLQRLPRFENTLFIYTSDHGDYVGSHGMDTEKIHYHEESLRIPAVFHWPGRIPARGECPELFSLVDFMPTILGAAELPVPSYNQGVDHSPALRGQAYEAPEEVLVEMTGSPRWNLLNADWRGIVTRDWKYAFYEDGHEALHDLRADPCELENLADSRPEQRERMKTRLLKLLRETRDPYFDVLIEHGVPAAGPVSDVSNRETFREGVYWKAGLTTPKEGEIHL